MEEAKKEPILEFVDVTFAPNKPVKPLSFSLAAGEVVGIIDQEDMPIADIAEGITQPASGIVKFSGKSWSEMSPNNELENRSLIGRIFRDTGWISNLNVMENITLAQRHHTKCSVAELEQKAEELAKFFGLNEVPKGRPALFKASELRICEWIRAFLGKYRLIIIENPIKDVAEAKLGLLTKKIEEALSGGVATLLIARSYEEIKKLGLKNVKSFVIE